MALADEINKAIGAHGMWRTRLKMAIESGKSAFSLERVRSDNQCDFGKWLYSLASVQKDTIHWKKVQELHQAFHVEAARVLELALKGQKEEAEKELDFNSSFSKASNDLTSAMVKWKLSP
jgi:methyl-accepting chemotaxis protein